MNGMIQGGWGYVYAAYGFTATALASYLVSVIWRLRAEAKSRATSEAAARAEAATAAAAPRTAAVTS